MIPYLPPPGFKLGPFEFHLFGALVAVGVFVGYSLVMRRAKEAGLPAAYMKSAALWALVPGFIGAATFDVIFYRPWAIKEQGLTALFDISKGMSSYGGFLGAFIGVLIHFRGHRDSWKREADILIQGITTGWIFGRLGCTFAHDHPGRLTDFFLAVRYPEGTRHNLGLYEFLWTLLVMFPAILWIHRRTKEPPGIYAATIALLYGPIRFFLDFLRSTDQEKKSDLRFWHLTFAQYCCIALTAFGVWALLRLKRSNPDSFRR